MDYDLNHSLSKKDIEDIELAYAEARSKVRSMARRWCRLRGHLWSKWWISRNGDIEWSKGNGIKGGYIDQERICFGCGKIEMKEERNC